MKKSIALATLLTMSAQFACAGEIILAPAHRSEQKIRISLEVMDGDNRVSSFNVVANSSEPIEIRAGRDLPYIARQKDSNTNKDIKNFSHIFDGVHFSIQPSITDDHKIKITFLSERSDVKGFENRIDGDYVIQTPDRVYFLIANNVLLENDKQVSLTLGTNTLNIHAKLEDVGGANE